MVTQAKFEEGLPQLKSDLSKTLNDSISELKSTFIKNLMESNKLLQGEVAVLKDTATILETEIQVNLQYNRQNNFLISGIPKEVVHSDLENIALNIMKVSDTESSITSRDVVACHRISVRSTDVVVRMVNRKYEEKTLDNRMQINHCSKDDLGLLPNTGKIYLNVHLTPYFSKLAFYCRKLKKNRFIHEISTKRR